MPIIERGKPLRINDLQVSEFVEELAHDGITTPTGKIEPMHPAQLEICNDPARFKVVPCGRRFGKSLTAAFIAAAVL